MNKKSYTLYKGAWRFDGAPHCETLLSKDASISLLHNGGLMVRNVYDFDSPQEKSFWFVIKDSFNDFEELSTKVRNQVRRSQKTFDIKMVKPEYLIQNGYETYRCAAEHYKVKMEAPSFESFKNRILSNDQSFDYWVCIDKGSEQIVAFSINRLFDDCCEYQTMKAHPNSLKNYPFYGLLFEMNKYYLTTKKMRYVNDGARSITNHSNIQPFLIDKFKFRRAYCHLNIVYCWWMRIAVNMLYPLKKWIPVPSVKAILNMEAMRRGVI
jgi:hypothetical protein